MIKKLDKVFSDYIRLRDADNNGIVRCPLCGTRMHWKEADCMHWQSRKNQSVRWDEKNCVAGCVKCNRFLDGNLDKFEEYLVMKYGRQVVTEIYGRAHSTAKFMNWEIEAMITNYKNRITGLKLIHKCLS